MRKLLSILSILLASCGGETPTVEQPPVEQARQVKAIYRLVAVDKDSSFKIYQIP